MIIYIILAVLIGILGIYPQNHHYSKQSKKIFLILSFSLMAFVLGLRASTVGEDTAMYLNVFEKAQSISWNEIWHNIWGRTTYQVLSYGYHDTIESSYLGLCKIIGIFTSNSQVYLFVISSLICGLFAKFIYDNTEHVVFATWIFLCDSMFMFAFNGIRQLLAISIALQAYKLLKESKYVKAIMVLILAFLVHNTSLVCLLMFPILLVKREQESKLFKYIAIASISAPFVVKAAAGIITRFLPRYINYFTTNYWTNTLGGSSILWIIELSLIVFVVVKKFPSRDAFSLSTFTALYLSLELMGLSITMFSRAAYFFRAFLILFIPDSIPMIKKKYRKIFKICTIMLFFLLYLACARSPVRTYNFFF